MTSSFCFSIADRTNYKLLTCAAHSAVVLKAESVAEKTEWLSKLRNIISSKGGQVKSESNPIRHSLSDGSLVSNSINYSFVLGICLDQVCIGVVRKIPHYSNDMNGRYSGMCTEDFCPQG